MLDLNMRTDHMTRRIETTRRVDSSQCSSSLDRGVSFDYRAMHRGRRMKWICGEAMKAPHPLPSTDSGAT